MNKLLILFLVIYCFYYCTPFDSNKLNQDLIQGLWIQTEIITLDQDSTLFAGNELQNINATLVFNNDSCIETIDSTKTRKYSFEIKDYFIKLEEKGKPDTYLVINKLTKDSLLFQAGNRILKYIRETPIKQDLTTIE